MSPGSYRYDRFFLVVFTRKYILQRLLKKRSFKYNKYPQLKYGTIGLYCLHTFRFEYRYCLFLRKFFKKLYKRKKRKITTTPKWKTWLFIRPNYTLTHKSKNARMGKGKGNFKRWCTVVYPGKVFIEHNNVPNYLYKHFCKKMQLKLKLNLKVITANSKCIKNNNLAYTSTRSVDTLSYIRVRKTIAIQFFN